MALPHWRIDVATRDELKDAPGDAALAELRSLGASIESVRSIRGVLLPSSLNEAEAKRAALELLADPVTDRFRITAPGKSVPPVEGGHRIEVIRKPGVMDPPTHSILRVLREMKIPAERAATFRGYEVKGRIEASALRAIAERSLSNGIVEDLYVDAPSLPFAADPQPARFERREIALLESDDAALIKISAEMALSLSLIEMKAIA